MEFTCVKHTVARNLSLLSLLLGGCAGKQPASRPTTIQPSDDADRDTSEVAVSAEVGGLNEDATNRVFQHAERNFLKCFQKRAKKIELLGGDVKFFVVVGQDGTARSVNVEQSDLGDRKAEKCMIDTLLRQSWPKPVGGRTAQAHYTAAPFELLDPDVREPAALNSEDLEKVLHKISGKVRECKGSISARFVATVYVDTDGKVITASVTSPDPDGEFAIDCLVSVIRAATFPSPGSYPGKGSFEL